MVFHSSSPSSSFSSFSPPSSPSSSSSSSSSSSFVFFCFTESYRPLFLRGACKRDQSWHARARPRPAAAHKESPGRPRGRRAPSPPALSCCEPWCVRPPARAARGAPRRPPSWPSRTVSLCCLLFIIFFFLFALLHCLLRAVRRGWGAARGGCLHALCEHAEHARSLPLSFVHAFSREPR